MSRCLRSKRRLLIFTTRWWLIFSVAALVLACQVGANQANTGQLVQSNKLYLENDDLDLAVAESATGQQQFTSPTSHEIIASGWPATSPMWPSIEMENSTTTTEQPAPVEPFIYADKPSKQDYSLLLTLNKSLIDMLTTKQKAKSPAVPLTVSLSFEYYLNHEPRVAALPGIKIEVDRKEFDYLEPAVGGAGGGNSGEKKPVKIRMWTRHSRQISLADAQHLDKPDWLKLSLVNRESPSLVAIRRLRVEFQTAADAPVQQQQSPQAVSPEDQSSAPPPSPSAPPPDQETPAAAPPSTSAQTQAPPLASDVVPGSAAPPQPLPPNQASPEVPTAGGTPEEAVPPQQGPQQVPPAQAPPVGPEGEQLDPNQGGGADQGVPPQADDQVPAASDVIASTIKPVAPKRKGWIPSILGGRRRRKRQAADASASASAAAAAAANATSGDTMPLVLTCAQSDACEHWKAEPTAGQIQWSLARMPPSIATITRGYFYVSNRINYGDLSRPLLLSLNQTESATIVDQAADHCVDLALYVTERTRLNLYKAVRYNDTTGGGSGDLTPIDSNDQWGTWRKSALLVTWAPTTISLGEPLSGAGGERPHLAGARLAATNQSGWTIETLCYGDFFERDRKCGLGECALAFEMTSSREGADGQEQWSQPSDPLAQLNSAATSGNEIDQPAAYAGPGMQDGSATPTQEATQGQPEQVVGVALLKQYAVNVPNKQAHPPRWLETWQRTEVDPTDNWRFYPRADFDVQSDNVSLVNLYTGAHYSLHSDWLQLAGTHLDFGASLLIELAGDDEPVNQTLATGGGGRPQQRDGSTTNDRVFGLQLRRRIVAQQNYETIYGLNETIDWYEHYNNATKLALYNLSLPNLSDLIPELRDSNNGLVQQQQQASSSMFKIIIDIALDCHWQSRGASPDVTQQDDTTTSAMSSASKQPVFKLMLANVTLADRCHPNPCQFGTCHQNGTELEDWQCACDAQHRGRRCEFGRWCQLAHVAPPIQQVAGPSGGNGASSSSLSNNLQLQLPPKKIKIDNNFQLVILKSSTQPPAERQASAGVQQSTNNKPGTLNNNKGESVTRVTGKEFCQRKLGTGSKCTEIDLPLNDRLYFDENETFTCSCQDDYYLSDDSKCRQAHQCNSIVCPSIGQICDESKPFNRTQPCHCNEKQDWYPAPASHFHSSTTNSHSTVTTTDSNKCIRRQCHDKRRDCGFDAHVCLPTLPGERPICKCGPKFALKQHERTGQKYCQSTACVLPTLNDCQHLCTPNDADLQRPYTCSCHEGYTLDKDGRTCKPAARQLQVNNPGGAHKLGPPHCKPACNKRTQVCTEFGCKCRQGYVPEGEIVVQVSAPPGTQAARNGTTPGLVNYVQSVRCLNVCSLSYAENKAEFERIESVCPLGLCEPSTFNCRCSDPNSSALVHTKYEPIWANETSSADATDSSTPISPPAGEDTSGGDDPQAEDEASAEVEKSTKRKPRASPLCHLKRVCQPDSASYQLCRARGAICVPDYTKPAMFDCICPPSSEKRQIGQAGDFQCEPRCSSIRQECLKKQAVCRPIDKGQVRCDCLPGMMLDRHDERCYLAHYSYAMNIIIVNKYYEPESRFHKLVGGGGGDGESTSNNVSTATTTNDATNEQATSELANEALHQLVPQFQRAGKQASHGKQSMFILDYNQCNLTQLLPKSIIEDPYEHDMGTFLQYMDQCNEKLHQNARTYNLNSRLAEDLRQSMRQHLRDFTVTTNNSLCQEMPMASGDLSTEDTTLHHTSNQISYLNCTVYLQSMEPVDEATINHVFTNCDKHGADERFCWIKPRLLLMKKLPVQTNFDLSINSTNSTLGSTTTTNPFQFRQIVPCEVNKFCGDDAHSLRLDERTSLCSCKCPADIEMIDLKELEPRSRALIPFIPALAPLGGATSTTSPPHGVWLPQAPVSSNNLRGAAIKEICAPRNHCGANSTYCSFKIGSVCQYDIRTGSRCNCVYPSYENNEGRCVEITFSQLDSTLIVVIIMVGTCLIVSLALNLYALAKSKHGLFSAHKEYPLNEFTSSTSPSPVGRGGRGSSVHISHRHPDDDGADDEEDAVSVSNRRHFTGNHNNRRNHSSGMNRSTGMPNLAFDQND